ncbi:translation initiation factor IF-2 [Desulfobulbus rhabdoformis]|uniref:translation initiation factor IF-2 n=1 Tax=Desulfobulbus rhabdoformis TaxID=34032 RepID=UPI001963CF50|nr:translation initiation factor IF-2 [Desulfobulbus rhabdoformis]MBM9613037.1 translation initiation factor IF-2 [Desulfobulbus rhabdoformis]
MSKVRIYDLAKEVGLKSKELAEKLIAMGYPIASHSSSVDDDMAADIRKKLKSDTSLGAGGGRIERKARTENSAAKPKTVRRRPKAAKEEAAKRQEAAEAEALEAEVQALEARLKAQEETKSAEPAAAAGEAEEVSPEESQPTAVEAQAETTPEPIKEAPAAEQEAKPDEEVKPASVAVESGPIEEKASVPVAENQPAEQQEPKVAKGKKKQAKGGDAPAQEKEQKAKPAKQDVHKPKPLAKIVGRVVIPQPEKRPKPAPAKSRPSRPARPAAGSADPGPFPNRDDAGARNESKGKKKGKRVVAIHEEDGAGRKSPKGGKKGGKGRVNFNGDGEVEYMRPRKGRKRRDNRREQQIQAQVAETKAIKRRIKVISTISVGDLAKRMGVKANEVIAALMKLGVMATVNQALDVDTAMLVASDFGYEVEQAMTEELELEALQEHEEEHGGEAIPRPPVVTVMGHVDHGKTSILDAIRKTDVVAGEAGGITQHIGAYHVQAPSGDLTFVDTPGHAAFTEMRSRGAKVTDIVVLVVAADDGVMDQTKEAIAHSKAADVPIVVAVNKIDKDNADPDRVKRELSDFDLIPEDWGGTTIFCETSAKKGIGVAELLEAIQLQAEMLELRADPDRKAKGTVIEAQLHKGRGAVATVLVQEGTLRPGDNFVAGIYSGKVRSLTNERGEQVEAAGPSIPVEVQGLSGVPQAGDEFVALADEKMAKSVANARQLKARETELASASKVSLDNLFEKMAEQEMKELRVILRADVQGTLQAFGQAAENLSTKNIRVRSLHEGTGSITENDIHLAAASDAIIIGFNVRPTVKVKELAEHEGVDVRSYDVIYHALEDIEKAMKGMLEPEFEERVIGTADVRDTFQVPKIGTIAGCSVIHGKVERNAKVRVLREGVVIYTGKISSLRRFKDDVKEVLTGFECGIGVENFNDIKVGDNLEAFVLDEVEATL